MVLQKRLDYGFNDYQLPAMPQASRSARGRGCVRKKAEINQICAFELLATVAGNLLQEGRSSPASSTVKQEQVDEENQLKIESCNHGSCNESVYASKLSKHNYISKELLHVQGIGGSGPTSEITNPKHSEKYGSAEALGVGNSSSSFGNYPDKVERGSTGFGKYCIDKVENGSDTLVYAEEEKSGNVINGTIPYTSSRDDSMELDRKPHALHSSDSSAEVPLCENHVLRDSIPGHWDDLEVVNRDDDENSSGCTQPCKSCCNMRMARIEDTAELLEKQLASEMSKMTLQKRP